MKTLTLKVPEHLDKDLAVIARERGLSKSALIREALTELSEQKRPAERRSALSLLEDLAGSMEGPEDLSTNQAYLEDLGH